MRIGLCTDSHAQIPPEVAQRYGIEVVPITVRIDDQEYLDGVDIDADGFHSMLEGSMLEGAARPVVTIALPSSGQFALAYEALLDRGCTAILSVHPAASASGTLNAARLAAHQMGVPVRLVDTGTTGFGVGCCVWAAADAVAAGASLEEAATVAESLAPSIGTVCVGPDCLGPDCVGSSVSGSTAGANEGIPVLALRDGQMHVVDRVASMGEAIAAMAAFTIAWGDRLHVGIGSASPSASPLADALADAVGEVATIRDVMRYRIGPSMGGRTQPDTIECFMFPSAT